MQITSEILLCSDLDRTLIPNGLQKESPKALPVLKKLVQQSKIKLVYVTGRNKQLVRSAMEEFRLPIPDYAIGDVGTTLYRIVDDHWEISEHWNQSIAKDWKDMDQQELSEMLEDIDAIRLQEPEKQNRYKLSYYADKAVDDRKLVETIQQRLKANDINAGIVWSFDEANETGLLDILPRHATKLHAIKFLLKTNGIPENRTIFAGDSGNDLDALTSGLQAVLVKNAAEDVRKQALKVLSQKQLQGRLYLARGDFFGMNGNYTAGVLEGLAHFFPETEKWIKAAIS